MEYVRGSGRFSGMKGIREDGEKEGGKEGNMYREVSRKEEQDS